MKRLPRWRPQLAVLVGIWAITGIAMVIPAQYVEPIRAGVTDALRPGRSLAATVTDHVQAARARFRAAEPQAELDRLRTEVAVLRTRTQQQQAEQVALIQQVSAETANEGPLSAAATNSLLLTKLVPALVLGRQPDLLRTRFARILEGGTASHITVDNLVLDGGPLMDQGTDTGVEENQPVLNGSVVVGNIAQTGRWTSTLRLVTDPEYRANVQLVRQSPAGPVLGPVGVLRGNGSKACALEFVPNTAAVSVGDYVYSRQQNGDTSAALYYGRVASVDLPAGVDDWTIEVEPAFDPDALQKVAVLTMSLNPQRIDEPHSSTPLDEVESTPDLFPPVDETAPTPFDNTTR